MGLTAHGVARDTGLPATHLHEIVHGRRGVSAETTTALGEHFDRTPEFWMNAQKTYEISKALVENGRGIRARIRRPLQCRGTALVRHREEPRRWRTVPDGRSTVA